MLGDQEVWRRRDGASRTITVHTVPAEALTNAALEHALREVHLCPLLLGLVKRRATAMHRLAESSEGSLANPRVSEPRASDR